MLPIKEKIDIRIGSGYDVHAFDVYDIDTDSDAKNYIILCGVTIPHQFAVKAHSDGDVAIHALVDAIFGAIGEGDIGDHFPPTDNKWRNISSELFLSHAMDLVAQKNAVVNNIDITIICEAPKISIYKKSMKQEIMRITNVDNVNIKATTTEKLGFIGQGQGIAAQAVVTVKF